MYGSIIGDMIGEPYEFVGTKAIDFDFNMSRFTDDTVMTVAVADAQMNCGSFYPNDLERALEVAKISAKVSHNHPEGVKGAVSVTELIWLANTGADKDELKKEAKTIILDFMIRKDNGFL